MIKIPRLRTEFKRSEMGCVQRPWISGLLCISFVAVALAGCRSAQQIASGPESAKPAAQAAGKPDAGTAKVEAGKVSAGKAEAGKVAAKQGAPAAEAGPGKDDQQLKAEAKQAESSTEQAAKALVVGIKEDIGAEQYPPSDEVININYASEERLLTLPGINHDLAMKIIHSRPYMTPTDLMSKHVLTKAEYDRIESRLTAWDNLWTNPD